MQIVPGAKLKFEDMMYEKFIVGQEDNLIPN